MSAAGSKRNLDEAELRQLNSDRATLRALGALARGKKLVDVNQAFQTAGTKPDGTPALAIAKASWNVCYCERRGGRLFFHPNATNWGRRQRRSIEAKAPPGIAFNDRLRAIIPTIPPRHRPAGHLSRYRILWEADWTAAPVDPVLLRQIGDGTLHVVLAVWDLTDVERAVLQAQPR